MPSATPVSRSPSAEVDDALAWLKRRGSNANRDGMARYGIVARNVLGVPMGDIQLLAREIGCRHELAEPLWATDCYEARLLVALACVPQSTVIYEGLYFMLVPSTRLALLAASLGSYVGYLWQSHYARTATSLVELQYGAGDALVACFYLPALIAILRRPNEGETPAWMERIGARVERYLSGVRRRPA